MKKTIIFISMVFIIFSFFSCNTKTKYLKTMIKMEEGVESPNTVEELKDAIVKYEVRVEEVIQCQEQLGLWYKMLGSRYLDAATGANGDKLMYGEALKAFQKAIEFYPTNQNLFYFVGICAGNMAKSSLDFNGTGSKKQHDNYLNLAESAYKRAIEIDPNHQRALYGLGVLYVFEMGKSFEAIDILQKLISLDSKNTDAMMVLARAYYSLQMFEEAIEQYDKIIDSSGSEQRIQEAKENKSFVMDEMYKK